MYRYERRAGPDSCKVQQCGKGNSDIQVELSRENEFLIGDPSMIAMVVRSFSQR